MCCRSTVIALFVCLVVAIEERGRAQQGGPIISSHRGGAHEYEENTLAAFRACYENGLRGFETDVRWTKDGEFVILHDDSLDRTHQTSGAVENKTAAELRGVTTKDGQKFLFLSELLEYFKDKPGVYIELEMKTRNKEHYPDERINEFCQNLYKAVVPQRPDGSTYVFTSFDERPLVTMRAIDTDVPTLITASKPLTTEYIEQAKRLRVNYIGCQLNGTSRTSVREAQKLGFKVTTWPGHTVQDYLLSRGLGADVHCTDIPTAVQKVKELLP